MCKKGTPLGEKIPFWKHACNDMFCHPQGDLANGNLSPKHVGRFKFMMYKLKFYCVHVLMCVNNYKHNARNE